MRKLFLSLLFLAFSFPVNATTYNPNFPDPIEFQYYGAVCDGSTDDHVAMNSALSAVYASGHCIHVRGQCQYGTGGDFDVDLVNNAHTAAAGICLTGDTQDVSRILLASGHKAIIHDSAGGGVGIVGVRVENVGFLTSNGTGSGGGSALQLGNYDFSDAINTSHFHNVYVNNSNTSSNCIGVQVNFVLNSEIDILSNCGIPSQGDAFQIRKSQFNRYSGSAGNALNGVHFTADNNFGDVFVSLDNEGRNGYVNDSSQTHSELILGGQLSFDPPNSGFGVISTAGSGDVLMVENVPFGSNSNQIGTATGVCLLGGSNLPGSYTSCGGGSGIGPGGSSGQMQGNNGTGGFSGLTNANVTAYLNAFSSSLQGAVPASGGGTTNFMRADGTWAVPSGGGGGGSAIQTTTISTAVASVTFGSLGSTYDEYVLSLSGVTPSTNSVNIIMDYSEDNCSTFKSSGYIWDADKTNSSGSGGKSGNGSDSSFTIAYSVVNTTAHGGVDGQVKVHSLGSTAIYKKGTIDVTYDDGAYEHHMGAFTYTGDTGAVNCLRVRAASGNLAAGTLSLNGTSK